jgi:hypothetical protein
MSPTPVVCLSPSAGPTAFGVGCFSAVTSCYCSRTRGGSKDTQEEEREHLQQAATCTPAREHDVLYHVVPPGTDARDGVWVPAPPPAVSVTLTLAGQRPALGIRVRRPLCAIRSLWTLPRLSRQPPFGI